MRRKLPPAARTEHQGLLLSKREASGGREVRAAPPAAACSPARVRSRDRRPPERLVRSVAPLPRRSPVIRRIHRPSPALVVACLALGVALSGTAVAASVALAPEASAPPSSRTTPSPPLRSRTARLLRADFKANQIPAGAAGPAGPAGPAGAAGAAGPAGPAGPSDAYARFLNGPIAIPGIGHDAHEPHDPTGRQVRHLGEGVCLRDAAAAAPSARIVAGTRSRDDRSLRHHTCHRVSGLATSIAHEFAAGRDRVDFRCSSGGSRRPPALIRISPRSASANLTAS